MRDLKILYGSYTKKKRLLYGCLLVVIFSIVSGVLGIEADRALHKGNHNCPQHSSRSAYTLAGASSVLMGMTLAIGHNFVKRPRLRSGEDSARSSTIMKVASATFLLAWVIAITSGILMSIGLSTDYPNWHIFCSLAKYHPLVIGGALFFVDAVVLVVYIVSCALATAEGEIQQQQQQQQQQGLNPILAEGDIEQNRSLT